MLGHDGGEYREKRRRRTCEILYHLLDNDYDASARHLPDAHADRTCGMGGKVRKDEEGKEMSEVKNGSQGIPQIWPG
jgi:hypothetical protein